ncbi:hypothetical protein [Orrella sp. 11846]|uniref:hypothetical protein n=1 Tax=Orrella sp. 11846 TaxID=3409913 RepID=UPI003B5C544A
MEISNLPSQSGVEDREKIAQWLNDRNTSATNKSLAQAWEEFDETVVVDERHDPPVLRSSARPLDFFNVEDLHFGLGFYRIAPGLFISIGLALTFLGLVAALQQMSIDKIDDAAMANLLRIASAKFIMSLTGLVCSIILTIVFRNMTGRLDRELYALCRLLKGRVSSISLEEIGLEQLRSMQETRDHFRNQTLELAETLQGTLRTDLPQAISSSISLTMQPILDKVSQQGTESISSMATDLSDQMSSSVSSALAQASEHLTLAGDKISSLADRFDQSSGRINSEMETIVTRVAESIDDLRTAMSTSIQATSGSFAEGTDRLLAAMNSTLESIRDNTGEGARAISNAALEIREAASVMRSEMEAAARDGTDAAKEKITQTSHEASAAINTAGQSIIEAFGKAGTEINELSQKLSSQAGQDLIEPLRLVSEQIGEMVNTMANSVAEVRHLVNSVRDGAQAGADAATNFRGASEALVLAATPVRSTTERIELAVRQMADGTRNAATTVIESAKVTAEAAAQTLSTAKETIAAERQSIESTLSAVTIALERLRDQGDRMDTIDQKLGHAFDLYTSQTESAMQTVRSHVKTMSEDLNAALSTLQTILDGLQEFEPQQGDR